MNSRPITQRDEGGSRRGLTVREDRHVTWIKSDICVAVAGEDNRDDEVAEVMLTNLSQGGFGTAEGQFLPGTRVMVDVPIIGWREAEVRWLAGSRAGCRFVHPLTHDQLRAAVSASLKLSDYFPGVVEALAV